VQAFISEYAWTFLGLLEVTSLAACPGANKHLFFQGDPGNGGNFTEFGCDLQAVVLRIAIQFIWLSWVFAMMLSVISHSSQDIPVCSPCTFPDRLRQQ
jgi:hypothetical protein